MLRRKFAASHDFITTPPLSNWVSHRKLSLWTKEISVSMHSNVYWNPLHAPYSPGLHFYQPWILTFLLGWHYSTWCPTFASTVSLRRPRSEAKASQSLISRERAFSRTLSTYLVLGLPCGRYPNAQPYRALWKSLSAIIA